MSPRVGGKDRGVFLRGGKWWVRYHDEEGREHRECIGAKSMALKVYQRRRTEIAERRFFPERLRPEVDVDERIRLEVALGKHKRSSKDIARMGRLWSDAIGAMMIRKVTPTDIANVIQARRPKVSAQTLKHDLGFIKRVFKRAIDDNFVGSNPAARVAMPKVSNSNDRFLTLAEEAALRSELRASDWPTVAFAIHTGMRQGEQFGMRWDRVDLQRGRVLIPKAKNQEPRNVELNATSVAILKALPRAIRCPWVWLNRLGTKLNIGNHYRRVYAPAVLRAGLVDVTWHTLRHTFASRLVMAGRDLRTVQALLGHKSQAMTVRYSHLSEEHLRSAVAGLDTYTETENPTGTNTGTDHQALQNRGTR